MSDDPWDGSFTETEAYFSRSRASRPGRGASRPREEVATELEGRRASVGFELRAHQLHAGDPAGAINALEAGTNAAPGTGSSAPMGNCSDVEDFERVDAADALRASTRRTSTHRAEPRGDGLAQRRFLGGPAALDAYEPVHSPSATRRSPPSTCGTRTHPGPGAGEGALDQARIRTTRARCSSCSAPTRCGR